MSFDENKIRKDFPMLDGNKHSFNGKPLIYFDNAATTLLIDINPIAWLSSAGNPPIH